MPKFVTFNDLNRFRAPLDEAKMVKGASESRTGKTVFLAHSTKDEKYLPSVISILENHGGRVYVDKDDERLPQSPSRDTAEILRSTIKGCRRFVSFVTENSKDSRWVPWELGLADGEKGSSPVGLFPAATSALDQTWSEQEYLGFYSRIVWGTIEGWKEPGWMVWDHTKNSATGLRKWLTQ
ncbi:MAG: toll/interleukin-1 receptor domain-containing protein [Verrucomicrobiales bacterium]|nr:toll/interleukin-1 receptor domain-containing protein [Verrucomicrobiales bacterium]